jgi:hypothetical protein
MVRRSLRCSQAPARIVNTGVFAETQHDLSKFARIGRRAHQRRN